MVLEDSKEAIKTDINTGGLNHLWFKGLYLNPAGLYFGGNIAVAQEHGAKLYQKEFFANRKLLWSHEEHDCFSCL
jgi:hypothetical protein